MDWIDEKLGRDQNVSYFSSYLYSKFSPYYEVENGNAITFIHLFAYKLAGTILEMITVLKQCKIIHLNTTTLDHDAVITASEYQ